MWFEPARNFVKDPKLWVWQSQFAEVLYFGKNTLLKKICTMWELGIKFYLWQEEDWLLAGHDSESSEKLLQEEGEEELGYAEV